MHRVSAEALRHYATAQAAQSAPSAEWIASLRRAGMAAFTSAGFPTGRDEAWKYTSLQALERRRFVPAQGVKLSERAIDELAISAFARDVRLVFVNGRFVESASTLPVRAGIRVTSLARMLAEAPERVRERLGTLADPNAHRFAALNAAFLGDGAWIELRPGVEFDMPIYLLFVSAPEAQEALIQPRVLIDVHAGARASVVEHHVSAGAAANLTNIVTELVAGPGAVIAHYYLLEEGDAAFHIAGLHARLERGSALHAHSASAGARLARRDLCCLLAGEGAEVTLDGLFVAAARRHTDQHLRVEHAVPHTRSRIDYRGVAEAHGRGVFGGKVVVHPGAQRTDAHQSSRNLLLAPQAEIDTRPELEIYADDVKCSHGATVGQLDADALFYLRSRGLDEAQARATLTFAFAHDLIARCTLAPVRARFAAAMLGMLPGAGELAALA
jgi:Fe-S cluster assembly protein SufD